MDNTEIRLGIIGCGAIVRAQHIPAILATDDFRIAALCDSVEGAARATAALLPSPQRVQCHASHRSMLSQTRDLDAVLVATPNHSHAAIVADCLRAGLDVFCEKPAAFTVEAHDRLQAMADQQERIVQVGLTLRYSPVFAHARELVQDGRIGRPLMLFINEFRPFAFQAWRYDKRISGGMFIEKNCHHFDLFHWMLGDQVRPRRVVAFGGQAVLKDQPKRVWALREQVQLPASEIVDHAWVLIDYDNGARAQLGISFFCPFGREFRMGLMGEKGKIDIYEMERAVFLYDGMERKMQRFPPHAQGFDWQRSADYVEHGAVHSGALEQWQAFAECQRQRKRPFCDLVRARESIRVALAAEASLEGGEVVRLGD